MVAGATGVDMFLLVVAADEGVMPQTREHLAVLEALDVRRGLIALTKCDRADDEARAIARSDARELVPRVPLVEVSARTGAGLDDLRAALAEVATAIESEGKSPRSSDEGPAVLHVDRAFALHGIGTVVTGTLWSGAIAAGDRMQIASRGREARVRRVQVHNRDVDRGLRGQRVALNLTGIDLGQVERGDVIASAGAGLRPSYRLDVELRLPHGAALDGRRVQVHHGTRAAPARVVELGDGLAQLRLESPLVARPGDRFVIRGIAPATTIGGGAVLDPAPRRHGAGPRIRDRLAAIREHGLDAVEAEERRQRAEVERERSARRRRPDETAAGWPLDERARLVLELLESDGARPRAPRSMAEELGIPRREAYGALDRLVANGAARRVAPDLYYALEPLERLREQILALASRRGEITLPEVRDGLGTSRKYAQALLEHLDATKATVRHGDRHVVRRRR
jgi:selenocysteine-specific elongation factor